MSTASARPLVLVRGFGGPDISDEQQNAYQGFNTGTVYPGKRGENYVYEGFVLRALKSTLYPYRDATNVVGFYAKPIAAPPAPMRDRWPEELTKNTVAVDPWTAKDVLREQTPDGTVWTYRYYDLSPRNMDVYGAGLVKLIQIIEHAAERAAAPFTGVDIVAHSMGGLVVRNALEQIAAANGKDEALRLVHRIVTLGTPHRGIAFQVLPDFVLSVLPKIDEASNEIDAFDRKSKDFLEVGTYYDVSRILTVVGTDFRTYGPKVASIGNRIASLFDTGSLEYNRSDGLVKQSSAQLPGAPRTFVHKCHGGNDSLVTSREAFEIAMRFFHATHRVKLWLDRADVKRGGDWIGRSEFFFGVSIKPRFVDFELFHQSPAAENCHGPFAEKDLSDDLGDLQAALSETLSSHGDDTLGWAGPDRLIWEGWIDGRAKQSHEVEGLVFRLDVYVGERDSFGVGFSDNVIFRKQFFVQALPTDQGPELFVHTSEKLLGQRNVPDVRTVGPDGEEDAPQRATPVGDDAFTFEVGDKSFEATFRVQITADPQDGST